MPYLLMIIKSAIYGSSVYFTSALSESTDVLDILSLRFIMSFVVFYLLKSLRIIKIELGIKDFMGKTERSGFVKYLFLAALFEPVLYMFFETVGITMSTGVTTGVILSLSPISSCIIESLLLKEKSSFMQKVFLGLGIVGVIYIAVNTSSSDGKDSVAGILFLLFAVISGSAYSGFSRKSSGKFSTFEITYFASFLGMVVFNIINVIRHIFDGKILEYFKPYFSLSNMIGFIFLAIISTIVATSMNNYAISKMQISVASAFGGISTLVTVLIGVLVGGEKLYMFHYIGFSLILIRMIGVSYISIKKENSKSCS